MQYDIDYKRKKENVDGDVRTTPTIKLMKDATQHSVTSFEEASKDIFGADGVEAYNLEGSNHLDGKDDFSKSGQSPKAWA